MTVHPSAIIGAEVDLSDDVEVGPYCVLDGPVSIGRGTRLSSHVVVTGRTTIGAECRIYPFASIGHPPQDLKYAGEPSRLEIGDRNVIREHVTMNPGTEGGGMVTRIGSDCLFMVGSHVAHDCQLADHVILANNATLAGHVVVGDGAILGGLSAVHQFVRIGQGAMIGGMSGVENDVIPYGLVMGDRASLRGINVVGLKRHGVPREAIHALRDAYRRLFENGAGGTAAERLSEVAAGCGDHAIVEDLVAFMRADSSRGLVLPPGSNGR